MYVRLVVSVGETREARGESSSLVEIASPRW